MSAPPSACDAISHAAPIARAGGDNTGAIHTAVLSDEREIGASSGQSRIRSERGPRHRNTAPGGGVSTQKMF